MVMETEPQAETQQCSADPDCPRDGRPNRRGRCWWHDLTETAAPRAEFPDRLTGSYVGLRPVGW
jgi:hypothetical protein